ncbi:hypothetical protein D3C71_1247230 [compost metagenome]
MLGLQRLLQLMQRRAGLLFDLGYSQVKHGQRFAIGVHVDEHSQCHVGIGRGWEGEERQVEMCDTLAQARQGLSKFGADGGQTLHLLQRVVGRLVGAQVICGRANPSLDLFAQVTRPEQVDWHQTTFQTALWHISPNRARFTIVLPSALKHDADIVRIVAVIVLLVELWQIDEVSLAWIVVPHRTPERGEALLAVQQVLIDAAAAGTGGLDGA